MRTNDEKSQKRTELDRVDEKKATNEITKDEEVRKKGGTKGENNQKTRKIRSTDELKKLKNQLFTQSEGPTSLRKKRKWQKVRVQTIKSRLKT